MIKTIGEMLESLRYFELLKLKEFDYIEHPTVVGDMYEGLTKTVIEHAIPSNFGLSVCTGFVRRADGVMSRQIDCMVVVGPGKSIGETKHKVYTPDDVIAIIEVKKTLYGQDLDDATELVRDYSIKMNIDSSVKTHDVQLPWRSISGVGMPEKVDLSDLNAYEEQLFREVCREVTLPLRVVIGYDGYNSEKTLRDGYLNYFEKKFKENGGNPVAQMSPSLLPNLILCNDSSLVKLNGMPFSARFSGAWPVYASRGVNPTVVLLELLWTRLVKRFGISSEIFGEDLDIESMNIMLVAKTAEIGELRGWGYEYVDPPKHKLGEGNVTLPWAPEEIDSIEQTAIFKLGHDLRIALDDPEFNDYLRTQGRTCKEVVESLCTKGLVFVRDNQIQFLTESCVTIISPDGKCYAGDNSDGRLERWLNRRLKKKS